MASHYDLTDYDAEDERANDPVGPALANLFAAADFIAALCAAANVPWAAMGGFAMLCLGSRRATIDIDVVVETSMRGVWAMVERQERYVWVWECLISRI